MSGDRSVESSHDRALSMTPRPDSRSGLDMADGDLGKLVADEAGNLAKLMVVAGR